MNMFVLMQINVFLTQVLIIKQIKFVLIIVIMHNISIIIIDMVEVEVVIDIMELFVQK